MSLVEYKPDNDYLEPSKPRSGKLLPAVYDPVVFEQMQRIAKMMAYAPLVPDHLKVDKSLDASMANCLLVVNQALKWRMDPFAVAQETFVHKGKIGYSGKLVAAALQSTLGIRLYHYFTGTPGSPDRGILVRDKPKGEETEREMSGTVARWQTKDKDGKVNFHWSTNTDDMLIYRGTRQWCRRYEPQVILGVLTDDELKDIAARTARDITPARHTNGHAIASDAPVRRGPPPAPKPSQPDAAPQAAPARKGPPPAPKTAPEKAESPSTEEPADDALPDPESYLSHLSEQMAEASTQEEFEDVWSGHKDIAPRLSDEHQKKAREMWREHQQRLMK